jgi:hypothetical protein
MNFIMNPLKRKEPFIRIGEPLQINLIDSSMANSNQLSFPEISHNFIFTGDSLLAKYDSDILLGHHLNSCSEQLPIHQNQQLIIMATSNQANLNASTYAVMPSIEQFGHEHISNDLSAIDIESFVSSLPEIDDFNMQISNSGSSSNQNFDQNLNAVDPNNSDAAASAAAKSAYYTFNFESNESNSSSKNQYSIIQLCNGESSEEKFSSHTGHSSIEQAIEVEKFNIDTNSATKSKIEFMSNVDVLNHIIMSKTFVNNNCNNSQINDESDFTTKMNDSKFEKALDSSESKRIKKCKSNQSVISFEIIFFLLIDFFY